MYQQLPVKRNSISARKLCRGCVHFVIHNSEAIFCNHPTNITGEVDVVTGYIVYFLSAHEMRNTEEACGLEGKLWSSREDYYKLTAEALPIYNKNFKPKNKIGIDDI